MTVGELVTLLSKYDSDCVVYVDDDMNMPLSFSGKVWATVDGDLFLRLEDDEL